MKKLWGWIAIAAGGLLLSQTSYGALLVQFVASEDDVHATVQTPTFLFGNLSLTDGGISGTEGGNILCKIPTTEWVNEYHFAYMPGGNAYQGTRDDTGYRLIINAAPGNTFDLDTITFRHRATANGPGTVGISVIGKNYSGTNDSVSTSVTEYASESLNLTGLTTATIVLQGWGSGGTGSGEFQMNNLQINGSVIPEPATLGLLLAAAGVLSATRRRRRKKP